MAVSWAPYDLSEMALSRFSVRSFKRAKNAWPARRPSGVLVKNRNCFGSCKVNSPRSVSRCAIRVTFVMPSPPAGPVPEDQLADELRFVRGDHLGDHAAHREAEEVDLIEAEGTYEADRVPGHLFDGRRRGPAGGTDTAVIEGR